MSRHSQIAVIGAGPAGLMAAEVLSAGGAAVTIYDRMPSAGRKLLMAGRGGLNLTHSEPLDHFVTRYGAAEGRVSAWLDRFPPSALVAWAEDLGEETFVGSSGRVFPKRLKASPLLRAWLARLSASGVSFRMGRTWRGWDEQGALHFDSPGGNETFMADAVVLALGGASWPRLGSDGGWTALLAERGVALAPFRPANCGFHIAWTPLFRERFAGQPLKGVALTFEGQVVAGEAMVAVYGLEGGAVYALSSPLREAIAASGEARLWLDLRPGLTETHLAQKLAQAGRASIASRLRKAGLSPIEANLLREAAGVKLSQDSAELARLIKHIPLALNATARLDRAISSAGGISLEDLDERLMLRPLPGVFAAGEMVDWEAPTGGYLLQASFASGVVAGRGALDWALSR